MSQLVGSFLTIAEYRSLTEMLNTLWYHEHSAIVRDRIKPFLRYRPCSDRQICWESHCL
eukprot:m.1085711 g.1085711  ORF g.1085711 m.1085711 type:complete len:59 (+) comp24279_c0_seq45:2401-2577(+)